MEISTRSHKNQSAILQRLSSVGQARLAETLGCHESKISRMKDKDGEIEKMARILSALGLQVVPADMKMYPDDQIDALFTLLRAHMNRADCAQDFFLGAKS